jgi:hypothetical protein
MVVGGTSPSRYITKLINQGYSLILSLFAQWFYPD